MARSRSSSACLATSSRPRAEHTALQVQRQRGACASRRVAKRARVPLRQSAHHSRMWQRAGRRRHREHFARQARWSVEGGLGPQGPLGVVACPAEPDVAAAWCCGSGARTTGRAAWAAPAGDEDALSTCPPCRALPCCMPHAPAAAWSRVWGRLLAAAFGAAARDDWVAISLLRRNSLGTRTKCPAQYLWQQQKSQVPVPAAYTRPLFTGR